MNSKLLAVTLLLALSACSYMPTWMGGMKDEKPPLPGERITVLPPDVELRADETIQNQPVVLPPPYANAEWPLAAGTSLASQGNLAATGFDHESSARAGEGEDFEHTLVVRPAVGGGMVFAMDAVGNVSAHDAEDISNLRWQNKGLKEADDPDLMGGGLAYDQGKLYGVSGRGVVAAWDAASGQQLWRHATRVPFRSAPRVSGGRVFAISIDSQTYAFDAASGQPIWNHHGIDETAELMNSVSPAIVGDTVIAPYGSGEIYALSATDGHELWTESLGMSKRTQASGIFTGIGGDPVIDGEVVFAVSNSGILTVLDLARGQHVWDRPVASLNAPWVAGNYLFVLSTGNTLVAITKYDGRIRWAAQLPSFEDMENKRRPIMWRGPVMAGGHLIVAGSRGEMKLISAADGSMTTKSIPSDIYTAPVIANGRMYLVGQDATLYSLQ